MKWRCDISLFPLLHNHDVIRNSIALSLKKLSRFEKLILHVILVMGESVMGADLF